MANTAELVARIGVDGMSQFLNDIGRASSAFDALGNVASTAFHSIEIGAAAAMGAFATFTADGLKHAATIESYTATFGALHHSMDEGRKVMAFYRQEAGNLNDTFEDLAPNLLRLQAVGLNPGAFMKTIDTMGKLLSPDNQSEGVRQAAEMFERAMANPNRLAVPMRTARNMGITNEDLKAQGIQISATGHIQATSEQWINAVVNTFKTKYSDVNDFLENSLSRKFSNLTDAWNHMLEVWGAGFAPLAAKVLDTVTPFMQFLANSGELQKIAASFASLFSGMKDGGWVRVLMFGVAVLEGMPDLLRSVWDYVKGFATGFGKILLGIVDIVVEGIGRMIDTLHELAPLIQLLGNAAQAFGSATGSPPGMIRSGMPGGGWSPWNLPKFGSEWEKDRQRQETAARTAVGGAAGVPSTAALRTQWEKMLADLPRFGNYASRFSARTDELMAQFDAFLKNPPAKLTNPEGSGLFTGKGIAEDEGLNAIKQTARNTENMSAHMIDFKRYVLGGGDRARTGVTLSERYGSLGRSQINVQLSGSGSEHLDRYLTTVVGETLQSMRRGGW